MTQDRDVLDWLLEGDPAIRWQVMRDLLDAPEADWQAERRRVEMEGWGVRVLSEQAANGRWGGGLYTPKWISTHYTLLLLRSMGLPPHSEAARRGAHLLLDGGVQPDGGVHFSKDPKRYVSETCVTGMVLAISGYFELADERLHGIFDHLMRVRTPDGGWNCQWIRGSKHASFHTTISVLEGLFEYERLFPDRAGSARRAQDQGREFLLAHRLFRSHRTGEVAKGEFTRFSFPPQWHYDVLRGLDYLRDCDADADPRLQDAVDLVRRRRQRDGRWLLQNVHKGHVFFEMERVSQPSRWNTLRALRVLRWWEPAMDVADIIDERSQQ